MKTVKSLVTGKDYDPRPDYVVRIINTLQIAAYLEAGVELLDLYTSHNREGKKILVAIFSKESSRDAYQKWCNHEL